jgi:NAD(P)H-dependent FMN reductase
MSDRHFLFLLSSGRRHGNSETLARHAAARLPADVPQTWRWLSDPMLPAFADRRHGDRYDAPTGIAATLLAETLTASDIVFVAPLYWYALPGVAKLYLDHWSHWMRMPELGFKPAMAQKRMWLVMSHASSQRHEISPAIETLRLSADYLQMDFSGILLGDANAPGEVSGDLAAMSAAERFFPV